MKKFFILLVTFIFTFALFAGCMSSLEFKETEEIVSKDNFNATGYPIVDESITIKVMGAKASLQSDWSQLDVMKAMEELTNIKLVYNLVPQDGYTERKNLAFASGDLPDLFLRAFITIPDEMAYGTQARMLLPLNTLIENYAPNLLSLMDEGKGNVGNIREGLTALDGNIYSLPSIALTPTSPGGLIHIRVDFLENTGMEIPTNTDELYEVLRAFKYGDPNKSGKDDIIPMSVLGMPHGLLLSAFGDAGGGRFNVIDDKVIFSPMTVAYREYVTYLAKLFAEGLIDNEMFSQTTQELLAKGEQRLIGVHVTGPNMYGVGGAREVLILPPLTSPINNVKMTPMDSGYSIGVAALTIKNPYPEATMRWIDVFYQPDVNKYENGLGGIAGWFGIEDMHYHLEEVDGEYYYERASYRNNFPDRDKDMAMNQYIHTYVTPGGAGTWPRYLPPLMEYAPILDHIITGEYNHLKGPHCKEHYFPYMTQGYSEFIRFTEDEQQELAIIEADLLTFMAQIDAQYVIGEKSMDSWDEVLETLKEIGVDRALEIRQNAYDRSRN